MKLKLINTLFNKKSRLYKKQFKIRKNKLLKFIKNNYNEFNGETTFDNILAILVDNYLEYYENNNAVFQSEKSRLTKVAQLKDCKALISKMHNDNYLAVADEFRAAHCKDTYVKSSDKYIKLDNKEIKLGSTYLVTWDTCENKDKYLKMIKQATKDYMLDREKLYKLIAKNSPNWWD